MHTTIVLDRTELLLWTILQNFEALALKQYELYVPVLATAEKRALVELLVSEASSNEVLEETKMLLLVREFMASAAGADEDTTLLVQGLFLETLGQTIYQTFKQCDVISSNTQALCESGLAATLAIRKMIPKLITDKIGQGDQLFQVLMIANRPILSHLDSLGEGLDQHFNKRFGISFADLMGDFVAELIPICTYLGINRRKLIAFLTSSFMGV